MAKERAKVQKDLLCMIVDSYDHAKMALPKYPMSRTPKRTIYEATRRILDQLVNTKSDMSKFDMMLLPPCLASLGTTLTLTGVICHGIGVHMYLSDEGLPGGANWTLECVTQLNHFTFSLHQETVASTRWWNPSTMPGQSCGLKTVSYLQSFLALT